MAAVSGWSTCSPTTNLIIPSCRSDSTTSIRYYSSWEVSSWTAPERQKKNPYLLSGYIPALITVIGRPQKKKESLKKASQVVISRVGVIES